MLDLPLTGRPQDGKNYNKWWAYGQAKTAVCLTAIYLAKKLGGRGLQVYSLHPGVTSTNLVREWNPEEDMPGMSELNSSK